MPRRNTEPLVVIHNPNSTGAAHFNELQTELNRHDISYSVYETESPHFDENVAAMQEFLTKKSLAKAPRPQPMTVLVGAGDGTATQLFNAIARSGLQETITTGVVDLGGFGDFSHAHNNKHSTAMDILNAPTVDRRPLTVNINGEYWRDAPAYITLGVTAFAAMKFDTPKSRQMMQRGPDLLKRPKAFWQLGQSYFEYRHTHLPSFHVEGNPRHYVKSTDIIFANNPYVGGIIKSADTYYDKPYFGQRVDIDVSHIAPNIPFGLQALAGYAPYERAKATRILFERASRVSIQTEGEAAYLDDVREVLVYKDPAKVFKVLHPRS